MSPDGELDTTAQHGALWAPILEYACAIDELRFDDLGRVFHADVVADYAGTPYRGSAAIIERMRTVHRGIGGSRHRLTNFRVRSCDGQRASTSTYVDAFLVGGAGREALTYRDIGTYEDELVHDGERWMIARRAYHRLWRNGDVRSLTPHQERA